MKQFSQKLKQIVKAHESHTLFTQELFGLKRFVFQLKIYLENWAQ